VHTLLGLGHKVIRMGSQVDDTLPIEDPSYIEYSRDGYRTELLDIYIGKICRYFISCGTGIEVIASHLFRKPMLYINISDLNCISVWSTGLCIFKKYWLVKEKRLMSLREIKQSGACCFTGVQHKEAGIALYENTAEEIKDVIMEMEQRLNGTWVATKDEQAQQDRFWDIYKSHNQTPHDANCVIHSRKVYRIRIGSKFLRDNQVLLD
jgi:putative glycosyltransferase (TIGR04372 family)